MPWVLASTGVRLYYEMMGDGPPLLMMDGVGARWVWYKNVPALSRHFRVITLDNRGTGDSDKPPGLYDVETMARETVDVIAALGLGPTHLLGLSLGGAIAMEIALTYPAAAAKLVLVGCTPGGTLQLPTSPAVAHRLIPWPELSPDVNFRRSMSVALSAAFRASHPGIVAELKRRADMAPTPPWNRASLYWAGWVWRGIAGRARRLQNPTLILAGQVDQLCPILNAYWLYALLPHRRLHFFPGTGHLCQIEQPAAFNGIVTEFLAEVGR